MAIHGPVKYEGANLKGSQFRDVDISEACFDDVNLSGAVFRNVALRDGQIEDADLTNFRIEQSRLDGMMIEGVAVLELLRLYRELSVRQSANLRVTEIKAFVPARDYALSKRFYRDIGFTMASEGGGVAYFHADNASFLLQDFCAEPLLEPVTMHMLVEDVQAWWNRIDQSDVAQTYAVTLSDIELQPWRMKDFRLTDPSGVVWVIAQNVG